MSDLTTRIANLSPDERKLLLDRLKKKSGDGPQERISCQKRESNTFPLSFAQERLWYLDQFEPNNPVYNLSAAFRIAGRLNVDTLKQSLNEIINRHEALRTTFSSLDGQPIQIIAPARPLALPVVDLRELPEREREAQVQQLTTDAGRELFNLARWPLLSAKLLRLADEAHVFLFSIHHIVFDGWSVNVLCQELAALYEAFCTRNPPRLPELPIQYADFAIWQREWLQREVLETQLAYWRRQLDDVPTLALPTDRPRPAVQTFRGARRYLALSRALSESLKALSQREGATLFMTLLAAFKVLLHRYAGQGDIVVGTPIANRNRYEIRSYALAVQHAL